MSSLYHAEKLANHVALTLLDALVDVGELSLKQVRKLIVKAYQSKKSQNPSPRQISQFIYNLSSSGFVVRSDSSQSAVFKPTILGHERLRSLQLQSLVTPTKKTWDKRWRILIYDIPETNRPARDALRRLIKQVGFKQLQRSVWIHPADSKAQVEEIQSAYGAEKHITFIETTYIDNDEKWRALFKL